MRRLAALTAILFCFIPSFVMALSAEQKGREIAVEADKRDTGFADSKASMKMILRNKSGQSANRALRVKTLEGKNEGDKSLIVFDSPGDVKGTALLTYTHKVKDDDQWLYLPAIKRVKRISSSNQSGPFMGSEFAYEDFNSQEVEKYTYKYIKDDNYKGKNCFLIERYPVNKNSGYKRQQVWIDKDEYRVQKVVFYDRKNALLKTLELKDYKQYLGKFWRAHTLDMQNHVTGKSTTLEWRDFKFKNGYSDSDFTKNSLKRAR